MLNSNKKISILFLVVVFKHNLYFNNSLNIETMPLFLLTLSFKDFTFSSCFYYFIFMIMMPLNLKIYPLQDIFILHIFVERFRFLITSIIYEE